MVRVCGCSGEWGTLSPAVFCPAHPVPCPLLWAQGTSQLQAQVTGWWHRVCSQGHCSPRGLARSPEDSRDSRANPRCPKSGGRCKKAEEPGREVPGRRRAGQSQRVVLRVQLRPGRRRDSSRWSLEEPNRAALGLAWVCPEGWMDWGLGPEGQGCRVGLSGREATAGPLGARERVCGEGQEPLHPSPRCPSRQHGVGRPGAGPGQPWGLSLHRWL